jgi:hypothetical protein
MKEYKRDSHEAERQALVKSEGLTHDALDSAQKKVVQFFVREIESISLKDPDGWKHLVEAMSQSGIDCAEFDAASHSLLQQHGVYKLWQLNGKKMEVAVKVVIKAGGADTKTKKIKARGDALTGDSLVSTAHG